MVTLEKVELDVVGKFKKLTEAALGTKSFYMRAKDTFRELFSDDKNWSSDYAKLASNMVGSAEASTTSAMMQLALQWAKEEKELSYSLSLIKAQIEHTMSQAAQAVATTAQIDKETEFKTVQIEAAFAASIRENGRVLTYKNGSTYIPETLRDEGVKYYQGQAHQANLYSTLADAFRKSGVVTFGYDQDGFLCPVSGDTKGYTWAQEKFAVRQIDSFGDSMVHQAGNIMAPMIGQMLSSETPPAPEDVQRVRAIVDYLIAHTPITIPTPTP